MLHQCIGLGKQRRAAIGQAVLGPAGATLTGDAVRVGEGQQAAKPARVFGVGHRLSGLAAKIGTELPGQLPRALHATLRTACGAALAGQQAHATVQIGTRAAQDVALGEQRRQVSRQRPEPQRLAAQQQMGDTRMRRQLSHRLAVGREYAAIIQRTKARQQITGLGEGGRRRHIQPGQL